MASLAYDPISTNQCQLSDWYHSFNRSGSHDSTTLTHFKPNELSSNSILSEFSLSPSSKDMRTCEWPTEPKSNKNPRII